MPQTYRVRDNETGRVITVQGDGGPPTDDELAEIFARANAQPTPTRLPTPAPSQPGMLDSVVGTAVDVGKGIVKSGLGLIEGGGQLIRSIPVVGDVLSRGPEVTLPVSTTPSNTVQAIGKGAGDIAQFMVPGMGAGGRMVRAAKAAGLTAAQTGGEPIATGAAGLITAALPAAGATTRAAGTLREGAERTMAQALRPTKEWAKTEADRLAPEMLRRGVGGSREAMLKQARSQTAQLGQQIGHELEQAAARGESVNGNLVLNAISRAKQALTMSDALGTERVIPGAESVVTRLDKLYRFTLAQGERIPIEKAHTLRKTWDQIVAKGGLYGQKVGASSTDNATAWATREAASAFRSLLNKANPTLADLNKEYTFWKGLQKVLTETERRTQGQGGGLTSAILGATGAGAGALSGTSTSDRIQNAIIGGVAGRNLVRLMQSAAWRTRVSAPLKAALADAFASGSAAKAEALIRAITQATPGQVASGVSQ